MLLKREVYVCLEGLRAREGADFLSSECCVAIRALFNFRIGRT